MSRFGKSVGEFLMAPGKWNKMVGVSDVTVQPGTYTLGDSNRQQQMGERKAWTKEEDAALMDIIQVRRIKKWSAVSHAMEVDFAIFGRTGKQCRERWHNQLDPCIKNSEWTSEEQRTLFEYHNQFGNRWAKISQQLVGRTDNCVKNHFYSTLRRSFRRLNRFVSECSKLKNGLKELKPVMLSKLVAAAEDKFDNKLKLSQELVNKSIELKNRLIPFAKDTDNSNEEELEMGRLIRQILLFSKCYKRKKAKKTKKSDDEDEDLADDADFEDQQEELENKDEVDREETPVSHKPFKQTCINLFSFCNTNDNSKEDKETKESVGAFEMVRKPFSKIIEEENPPLEMFKKGSNMSNWSASMLKMPSFNERISDMSISRLHINLMEASGLIDKGLFSCDFEHLND